MAQPHVAAAEDGPEKAAAGGRKWVQPGTAALRPIGTAKVIFVWNRSFVCSHTGHE